ncbi:hypothetical protein VNO77_06728 [Canavalia gladiata]|uniref:Uncharacterized protein n=1 Tax=Canavalia gladiata TaxID=3824 RepID=A0AAN9M6X4_CANGL
MAETDRSDTGKHNWEKDLRVMMKKKKAFTLTITASYPQIQQNRDRPFDFVKIEHCDVADAVIQRGIYVQTHLSHIHHTFAFNVSDKVKKESETHSLWTVGFCEKTGTIQIQQRKTSNQKFA